MPSLFPAISGVLNNCPLHVLTPELRQEIQALAEDTSTLALEFKTNYEVLKTEFARFYEIEDPANFSWQACYEHLKDHSGFDLQLILGPVLRKFMAKMMENHPLTAVAQAGDEDYADKSIQEFIAYKTEMQDSDGRYASLSPDEMFLYVASPLGLRVAYHQEAQLRAFPEDADPNFNLFRERPLIEMFHQGGVEGACAGGHFERTENANERMSDEQDLLSSHLRVVAGLFRHDTPAITAIGLKLLRIYMLIARESGLDRIELTQTFHLTVAQVEKYFYNRLHVDSQTAKLLVGDLTEATAELLNSLPDQSLTNSDAGVLSLIHHHHPSFNNFNRSLKAELSEQQYQVALTMLAPAVPQTHPHSDRTAIANSSRAWTLRGNEIAALQTLTNEYVEHVLFNQGLSLQLYALCNKPEIALELSPEFLDLLIRDLDFDTKASLELKNQVIVRGTPPSRRAPSQLVRNFRDRPAVYMGAAYSSPWRNTAYDNVVSPTSGNIDMQDIYSTGALSPESGSMPATLRRKLFTDTTSEQPRPRPVNSLFWLRAMQGCLAIGGLCAIVALLTCPPVATALGLSTVLGVTVSDIAVTATFLAASSALLAASFFAMRQTMEDPVQAATPVPR